MEYVKFGRSGLKVSRLAYGLGLRGQEDADEAERAIERAVELGINFIDCANIYGFGDVYETRGTSEQVLARVLRRHRDDLVVTSKVASRVGDGPNDAGLSRYHIMREIDRTLARLETDHIDVYILHMYDDETPLEETLRALDDVVCAGKTRYVGVSNFQAWQVLKALWTQDRLGLDPLLCIQNPYNLLNRELEREMWPAQRAQGFGVMTYSPLGVGLLSGVYTPGEPPPDGTLVRHRARRRLGAGPQRGGTPDFGDPAAGRRRPWPHRGADSDQLGALSPRGDGGHYRRRYGGSHGGERRRGGLVDHAGGPGSSRRGFDRPGSRLGRLIAAFNRDINSQRLSENSEYRSLYAGPAHWIPAFAGMTYRGSTRPKAGFQTASQARTPQPLRGGYTARFYFFDTFQKTQGRLA